MMSKKKKSGLPIDLMWAAQGARTKAEFDDVMRVIGRRDRFFYKYLIREECPPSKWAHYASLKDGISTFEHRTSKVVDSVNGT